MSEYTEFVSDYMAEVGPTTPEEAREALVEAAAEWRALNPCQTGPCHNPQFFTDSAGRVHPMRKRYKGKDSWGGKYSEAKRINAALKQGRLFNPAAYTLELCPVCDTPLLLAAGIDEFECPGCGSGLRQV